MGGSNFQLYDLGSANSYTSATTTVVPSIPADKWRLLTFTVSGLAAETVTLQGSLDGGATWNNIRPIDNSTGAVTAAVTLGNGCYRVNDMGFPLIKVIKSAAANTATVWLTGRAF